MGLTLNFVTVREAADILGMTRARVLQLIYDGRIPAEKLGGAVWVIREDALEKHKESAPVGRPRSRQKKS